MPSMFCFLRSIISGLTSATAGSRDSSSIKESRPSREPELGGSVKTLSREALSESVSFLNPAAPTSSKDWVSSLARPATRPPRHSWARAACPGCPGSSAPGQQISANNQGAKTEANGLSRNCLYMPPCIIASHLLLLHVGYVLAGQGGGSGAGGLDTVTAWGGRQLQ